MNNPKEKIELGDEVRDIVSGFKGIAIGRTTWMFGCDRITVHPQGITKEGKTFDTQSFDEPSLVVIKKAKPVLKDKPENHETGGPRAEPQNVKFKQ